MTVPAIQTDSISKTYRTGLFRRESVRALDGVSLTVEAGEVFGLLGPNGAGKTTLLKILLGIAHPSAGRALLFGTSVERPEARARVGFLPEKHRFPDFLTAEQMLHVYGRMSGMEADTRNARIPELLERVGMGDWQTSKIKTFSKGMMQRLGLAQSLLNDPDLVFLDEPADGVDPVGRREIRDLLVWLRSEGKTVFLNSHLLSEVEQVCSQVAILNKGVLVRQGTIAELTASERVYTIQATAIPDSILAEVEESLSAMSGTEATPTGVKQYRALVDTRRDLNALIDRLRTAGVELEAVQPVRRTLEDYFIDVVSSPDSMSTTEP